MEERKGIKIWKLLFLISIVLFIVSIYFYIASKPKQIKKNIINNNYEAQIVNGITLQNIKIYEKDGKYFFTAKALNKTKKDIKLSKIKIKLDSYTFYSYIGSTLKSKEYKMIFMETNKNISNIKKIIFIF